MYLNKKISVVMATYNGEKYFKEQIDSILNQSIKPDEILICDDRSSDQTIDIVNEYIGYDNIICLYCNERNMGYTMNFLNGAKRSSGDIVFLSDQDDIWDKYKIEHMLEVLEKHPEILVLSCGYDLIDGNGNPLKSKHTWKKNAGSVKAIKWDDFIKRPANVPGMSLAIKREIINSIELDTIRPSLAHDWLINEIAAYHKGLFKLSEILVHYRQHGNNAVGVVTNYTLDNLLKARLKILNGYYNIHCYLQEKYCDKPEIVSKMEKLKSIDEQRKKNVDEKRIMKWFLLYIRNYNLLSFFNYCGDGVTILKLLYSR